MADAPAARAAPRASVAVVVVRPGAAGPEFLVLRRAPAKGGGWQPVTGRLEPGETHEEAARREVREETGCEVVAIADLQLQHAFTGFDGVAYIERSFAAEVARGAAHAHADEHDAAEWLGPDAALARLRWEENRVALRATIALFGPRSSGSLLEVRKEDSPERGP